MTWEGSTRRRRLPADWEARRRVVAERARGRCEAPVHAPGCAGVGSQCDHIVAGDNHALSNLQWLSGPCHEAKTLADKQAWKRKPEPHPGLR